MVSLMVSSGYLANEKLLVRDVRDDNIHKEFHGDTNRQNERCRKRVKRSNSVTVNTSTHSEKREGKLKGNGEGTIQAPFATLEETIKVNWNNLSYMHLQSQLVFIKFFV